METATLTNQDRQLEKSGIARHQASRGTTTPPAYDDWKRTRGWKVDGGGLSDLEKGAILKFNGTGSKSDPQSTLDVTHIDGTTTFSWGTGCDFNSGDDSVTLDHVKPDGKSVSLTINRSETFPGSGHYGLSCLVADIWFGHQGRRRRQIQGGSWTAVEG